MGGTERMKRFPELVSQEIKLKGRGHLEAASDITLTSAGKCHNCFWKKRVCSFSADSRPHPLSVCLQVGLL